MSWNDLRTMSLEEAQDIHDHLDWLDEATLAARAEAENSRK